MAHNHKELLFIDLTQKFGLNECILKYNACIPSNGIYLVDELLLKTKSII